MPLHIYFSNIFNRMRRVLLVLFIILIHTNTLAAPDCDGKAEATCPAGCSYTTTSGCKICPANTFGEGGSKECQSCSQATGGTHTLSGAGSTTKNSCYKQCTQTSVPLGTKGKTEQKYFPNSCSETITCVANATLENGECKCKSGYDANAAKTACEPGIRTITLQKNLTGIWEIDKYVYVKYGEGFATNKNASTWGAWPATTPTLKWSQEFIGYFTEQTGGNRVVQADGTLGYGYNNASSIFKENVTLFGHWNGSPYTVNYYDQDGSTKIISHQCTMKHDSDSQATCFANNLPGTVKAPEGHYFEYWSCKSPSCTKTGKTEIKSGDEIPEPQDETEFTNGIILTAVYKKCDKGWYCPPNMAKQKCPLGSTSDAGKTSKQDCYITTGNSGTRFCDGDGTDANCFTLPGTGSRIYVK